MSIFDPIFGRRQAAEPAAPRDWTSDFWFQPLTGRGYDGPVTVDAALQVPVVYACVTVLAETIGTLPFMVYERRSDGSKREAGNHPLVDVLSDPSPEMGQVEFLSQLVWQIATEGNALCEIEPGPRGPVDRLHLIEWRHVTPERMQDRSVRYRVAEPGMPERTLLGEEVWHLRRMPIRRGMAGTSPVEAGARVISAALALQDYAGRFFGNDATPPWAVRLPQPFKDQDSRDNFLHAILRSLTGKNRHKPFLLEHGAEIQRLGVNNEEAQFLETRKELSLEIARLWRMQPHKIGILDRATFSNIEEQSLDFVVGTILPWLRLIERSVQKHLMLSPRHFIEFDVSGQLRGDIEKRFNAYATARQWGLMSVNEIRGRENMNPIGRAGDRFLEPANMREAGAAAEPVERDRALAVLHQSIGGHRGA